jgi:hypothetical protein
LVSAPAPHFPGAGVFGIDTGADGAPRILADALCVSVSRPWGALAATLLKGWTMGEFEIELVLAERSSVIGKANDEESALNLMAEAIRQFPRSHIRVRRNTEIIAERVPPRNPK